MVYMAKLFVKQRHDSEIELCVQNMDTILLGSLCGVRQQLRGLAAITAVAVVARVQTQSY